MNANNIHRQQIQKHVLTRRTGFAALNHDECEFCDYCTNPRLFNPSFIIHSNYYDKFNFYFAKPINEILAGCSTPHTILFKDLLALDEKNEYLKRFYSKQINTNKIFSFRFQLNFDDHYSKPNLVIHKQLKIVDKRFRKMAKIDQNKVAKIKISKNPSLRHSRKMLCSMTSQNNSFETEEHDIYSQNGEQVKQQPQLQFTLSFNDQKLYELDNYDELNEIFDEYNMIIKDRFKTKTNDFSKFKVEKKKVVPALQLDEIKSNKNLNIMQLMQQFSKIQKLFLKQKFQNQVKGFYTERIERKEEYEPKQNSNGKKSVSPRLVNLNKFSLKDNYQSQFSKRHLMQQTQNVKSSSINSDGSVFRRELKRKKNNSVAKTATRVQIQELSSTCEQTELMKKQQQKAESEKLLWMLKKYNISQPVSPHRKQEIKLNLKKLIIEQHNNNYRDLSNSSYGYWTNRNSKLVQSPVSLYELVSKKNSKKETKQRK